MNSSETRNSTESISPAAIGQLWFSNSADFQKSTESIFNELTGLLHYYGVSAKRNVVESTHQIRKKLKFFRAFAKLLRDDSDPLPAREVNRFLRDSGRTFSDLRDSHVRSLLLTSELHKEFQPDPKEFSQFLNEKAHEEKDILEKALLETGQFTLFADRIGGEPTLQSYFTKTSRDYKPVLKGYLKSFTNSATAFEKSRSSVNPEDLHEWRKRLKDVQYQTELIPFNQSEPFLRFYEEVSALCTTLGDINDLSMFRDWLETLHEPKVYSDALSTFSDEIHQKHENMVELVTTKGRDLYHNRENRIEKWISEAIGR